MTDRGSVATALIIVAAAIGGAAVALVLANRRVLQTEADVVREVTATPEAASS
jgi:hypothetical protein